MIRGERTCTPEIEWRCYRDLKEATLTRYIHSIEMDQKEARTEVVQVMARLVVSSSPVLLVKVLET